MTAGNAAAAESRYQAQIAANNALIAQQNANYATAAGEARAADQAMKERAKSGAVRAALAASGLDVNTGSAEDAQMGRAELGQIDTERVRSDAALTAYGYRTQATNFQAQSQLDKAKASFDSQAGLLKGFGSLLSGASSVGTKWLGLRSSANSDFTGEFGDWSARS